MSPSNRPVAVLGLGSIGFRHAGNLLALDQPVVGFDPDPARRERFAAIGGRPAASREEALATSRAVVVASPSEFHLEDLGDAIRAGSHVFVEKPLCHRPDGVLELLAEGEAKGLVVFAGLNLRYHPAVERAKQALEAGEIGRVLWARLMCSSYLPAWHPDDDYRKGYSSDPQTGGILFDDVHEVDLANHLLGPAQVVAAAARRTGELEIEAEDCAEVILCHDGGWHSAIHMDFATKVVRRVTEVAGTEGIISVDIRERRFTLIASDGSVLRDEILGGGIDDDYLVEMAAFLACTRGEARPRCVGREALMTLEQVLAARRLAGLPES